VRLGDALHSLTLTEISLLPFGARSMSVMLQAIGALLSLLSANTGRCSSQQIWLIADGLTTVGRAYGA
jgi:hypothetical protein